jgi:hypothetical protein
MEKCQEVSAAFSSTFMCSIAADFSNIFEAGRYFSAEKPVTHDLRQRQLGMRATKVGITSAKSQSRRFMHDWSSVKSGHSTRPTTFFASIMGLGFCLVAIGLFFTRSATLKPLEAHAQTDQIAISNLSPGA